MTQRVALGYITISHCFSRLAGRRRIRLRRRRHGQSHNEATDLINKTISVKPERKEGADCQRKEFYNQNEFILRQGGMASSLQGQRWKAPR